MPVMAVSYNTVMPWLNKRWISFFSACTAVMIIIISVLGWINFKDGVKKKSKLVSFGVNQDSTDLQNAFTNWTASDPALAILVNIDAFDPGRSGNALGFHFEFQPINTLAASNGSLSVPALPVRLVLGTTTVDFPANTVMADRPISQILTGDINRYPFDAYTVDYTLAAFASAKPLHLTVFGLGTVQGFTVDTKFQGLTDDGSQLQITFMVTRSGTSKVFAIIIFIFMWCLSLSIFVAAISIWFRGKKVELPVIAISTGLLFALPNVRNSQPGIPIVAGTTSDMVGFFWNLLLVAISAVSLLIKYIIQNKRERPKHMDPEHLPTVVPNNK